MMLYIMFFISILMTGVMMLLYTIMRANIFKMTSSTSAIESGLALTGKSHTTFSLQYFSLMLLFLILDLEVIFIISLLSVSYISTLISTILFLLIGGTLWMEWSWGKLVWSI